MVVREQLSMMAESLLHHADRRVTSPTSAVQPLTVDVLSHRDSSPGDRTPSLEPSYEVKQGGTRLSSQNLAVLTSGLKIMTSLRGHFVTKVKSVDGLSSSSRRSEDDDGYCSRSSLDSPVQTRPEGVSPTAEDALETFADVKEAPANFPPAKNQVREDCVGACDGANDVDCNSSSQTVAAVASLDHCYLTAAGKDPEISPDDSTEPPTVDCDRSLDEAGAASTASGRRNISIFVVPQPMPSTGLRWRARIIRAGTSPDDESRQETVSGTTASEKPEPSPAAQSSWLPLSAVTAAKPAVGTTTHVAAAPTSARRGYRQRLTVGSRLAALTATADSLSRQIARVAGAASSARAVGRPAALPERRRATGYHVPDMTVRLHPLVDHDYGAFATFNAEVQSSIISTTTDGVGQLDWRSIRRHRPAAAAARGRSSAATDTLHAGSSTLPEFRQKRKYCRRQEAVYGLAPVSPRGPGAKPGRKGRPPAADARRQPVSRKRPLQRDSSSASLSASEDDSRSYVKIPGHYQDDFVYYATKRARGRPRKNLPDPATSTPATTTSGSGATGRSVGGINVFDWYREMAQTDKSTRFGVTTAVEGDASPPAAVSEVSPAGWGDTTPVDESAVADLVMDMLPSSSAAATVTEGAGVFSRPELTVTEEDVCAMLRSLNEADLRILESHLGASTESDEAAAKSSTSFDVVDKVEPGDTSLSQYLNDCGRDSLSTSLAQTNTSNGLLDVDEISDGDLLSADIGNMNAFLSDLRTPTRDLRTTNLPVTSKSNLSALFDAPDYSIAGGNVEVPSADVQTPNSLPPETSAVAPPELCMVNMYWNDLPGLVMEGREYVRLVDIHRQVLPAKDTGILKKRCYMLGLDVRQCSELQRDFLIRYMNAAKSKSTVVVSRPDAIELIGFYVTPKSKCRTNELEDAVLISHPDVASTGASQSQPVGVACRPEQPGQQVPQPLMMTHNRLSPPAAAQAATVSTDSGRRSVTEKTSPVSPPLSVEGLKRSERLRDRRVHYADMVLGVHPRCASDGESKSPTDHPHGRPSVTKSPDRSMGTSTRTSNVETPATPVTSEPQTGSVVVNGRRRSMDLRSSGSERRTSDEALMSVASRRRPSGNQQVPQEVTELVVERRAEDRPGGTVVNRRGHRGGGRHRRRLAAMRQRSKLSGTTADSGPTTPANDVENPRLPCPIQRVVKPSEVDAVGLSEIPDKPLRNVLGSDCGPADRAGAVLEDVNMKSVEALSPCGVEQCVPELLTVDTVLVSHAEFSKRGRRRHTQDGVILLDRYWSVDAACVRCSTCGHFMSVAAFTRHLHYPGRNSAGNRRLGPRGQAGPAWREFLHRRMQFTDGYKSTRTQSAVVVDQTIKNVHVGAAKPSPAVSDSVSELGKILPTADSDKDSLKPTEPMPAAFGTHVQNRVVDPAPVSATRSTKDATPGANSTPAAGTSAAPLSEVRVTRSRGSSELNLPALGAPVSPADTPVAALPLARHSRRAAKAAAELPAPHYTAGGTESSNSRVELRPRVPPRANAPK